MKPLVRLQYSLVKLESCYLKMLPMIRNYSSKQKPYVAPLDCSKLHAKEGGQFVSRARVQEYECRSSKVRRNKLPTFGSVLETHKMMHRHEQGQNKPMTPLHIRRETGRSLSANRKRARDRAMPHPPNNVSVLSLPSPSLAVGMDASR